MSALPVFLVLCLAATGLSEPLHKRIVNGNDAEPGSHPYIVFVQSQINSEGDVWGCGGTLISRDWVLTAAHCLYHNGVQIRSNNTSVLMGNVNRYHASKVNIQPPIIHPGYKAGVKRNDIALIKLLTPATLNKNVKIASLAEKEADFLGEKCVLAGWGDNSTGHGQVRLQEVEISVISKSVCKTLLISALKKGVKKELKNCSKKETLLELLDDLFVNEYLTLVTEKHICVHDATPPEGSRPSACNGDSGGPMMCGSGHNVLAGVAAWVIEGCSGDHPSVYTRVSAYRDWIDQYVRV